jgi:SAM-dependent methyltransferase
MDDHPLIANIDHLHFGLWPDGTAGHPFEEALQNMFDRLVSSLPEPPAKILNVGCGLGHCAHSLDSRGYVVTAIDTSHELIEYARQQYGSNGADFRVADYFDSNESIFAKGSYDALFFQESLQYLQPLDEVMRKARYLLKDRGTIIIADEVCYDRTIRAETALHMATDIYTALSENGFRITENQQIGEQVLPTWDFVINSSTPFDQALQNHHPGTFLKTCEERKIRYIRGQCGYEVFVAKKDPFLIRGYQEGDEHKILPMFNEVFRTNRSMAHWYWKFRDNPYGSHRISVGVSDDDGIVSQYAGYPVPFCSTIEGGTSPKCFMTLQAGDTFTSPKVRRIGLGKTGLLARTTFYYYAKFLEGFVPFAYGFNTAKIKKLGERYLGYSFGDPVLFWVKNLSQGPIKGPGSFSRIFSGFAVEKIQSVDEEWDDLFHRVCPAYAFLVKRDAAYVKWRYLDCPDKDYNVFTIRKRGTLVGWSVFILKDNRLLWGDALFDNRHPRAVSYLIWYVLKEYFSRVEAIEAWFSRKPDWWVNHIKTLGFLSTREPNGLTLCYRIFRNDELATGSIGEKLRDRFYYTWGDSDLF